MKTRFFLLFLPLLFVSLAGLSGAKVPQEQIKNIDELVDMSRSKDRAEWWGAVQKLGETAKAGRETRELVWDRAAVNSAGMKFVKIDPGRFTMGPDKHRVFNVQPAHDVHISNGYFISVTEVTNAQFQEVDKKFKPDEKYSPRPDSPATNISWEEARDFCESLSKREGVEYRLPTEAEWEFACRAGSDTLYSFGDGIEDLSRYAWFDRAAACASPVALLRPNAWGLFDMHGNVFEWVSDWYSDSYYSACAEKGLVQNPTGPSRGRTHVLRGGAWNVSNCSALTSAARFPLPVFDKKPFSKDVGVRKVIGFRIVREVEQ